jgi:hypothetical protein
LSSRAFAPAKTAPREAARKVSRLFQPPKQLSSREKSGVFPLLRQIFSFLMLSALVGADAAAAQSANSQFQPAPADQRVVYRNATLFDGTGSKAAAKMSVVTRGETIEAVLADALVTPEVIGGALVVDLSGKFLLPGLIDSHQHIATPPDRSAAEALLRRDIYSGITATRIMADDLRSVAEIARAARVGEIPSPDLVFAALMAGPSFFDDPRTGAASQGFKGGTAPWMQAIDDRTDLPLAVAKAAGTGATAIKIYSNLPPHLVRGISAEAHRQGLQVWAHGMVFPTLPADVISSGPDVISHTCYLAYQVASKPPQRYQDRSPIDASPFAAGDNPVMAALFRDIKRRGIVLDPTLRVYRESEERAKQPGTKVPYCTLSLASKLTQQAYRAGVAISAGTDGDALPSVEYPGLFDELELLVKQAGMTPLDSIRAATSTGARALGEEESMGTIEPGKLANMVVLSRSPLEDITNMRSVVMTVKRGRSFARADFKRETVKAAGHD